ncbi:hypothetical protein NDN08_003494 [Rhodosorus marinus]|uniref:G domain-containing protein n=1 Tax=Rhodosorus marinus TaxID=101924 RepID=A0AAV8UWN4_9RHOD|nr:hypothetical protein NDN08_003494 [Rhodosorus marinus]
MSEELPRVRIFVFGDTGVGKTALCKSLCRRGSKADEVSNEGGWTVGCRIHVRKHQLDQNSSILVEFCDVGGSAKFEDSRLVFLRRLEADGVVFVHDLTWVPSRASIRRLWLPEVVRCLDSDAEGQSLEEFFNPASDADEVRELFSAIRRGELRQCSLLLIRLGDRLVELIMQYVREFLGDDLAEKAQERAMCRSVTIPMLFVGMKRDLATRDQRKLAKADLPPSVPYAELDAKTAPSNPSLVTFLQQTIQHRRERGNRYIRNTTTQVVSQLPAGMYQRSTASEQECGNPHLNAKASKFLP